MILLQDIPQYYAYCFAGKDLCPKAATCLRAIAAQTLAESEEEGRNILYCINPVYVQRLSPADSCRYYRNNKPVRYAKGMTQLFEDLPLKQSRVVRLRVMQCFSCESYFYQSRKGERLITPDEQEAIRRVFRASGVTSEPKFDDFQYSLAWEG